MIWLENFWYLGKLVTEEWRSLTRGGHNWRFNCTTRNFKLRSAIWLCYYKLFGGIGLHVFYSYLQVTCRVWTPLQFPWACIPRWRLPYKKDGGACQKFRGTKILLCGLGLKFDGKHYFYCEIEYVFLRLPVTLEEQSLKQFGYIN